MPFKIGDSVMVLDEDMSGTIRSISGDDVTIETEDGFSLRFNVSELIKQKTSNRLKQQLFVNTHINDVISEKETPSKAKQPRIKIKERYEPTMEVDLHIHQLVRSTKGLSNHDMLTLQLDTAKRQLEFAINKRIQKVVFIHGVGEGVLKVELEYLFSRYDVKYYDANYQKYGLGATEVYIYQNPKN